MTIGLIAAIAAAIFFWRRPRSIIDPATALYQQACAHFAKLGWPRDTGEAPRDYLTRIAQFKPNELDAMTAMTELFEQSRFADEHASASQLAAMQAQLTRIQGKSK
jgi:hypothetical protein